jgi:hypothetical protein
LLLRLYFLVQGVGKAGWAKQSFQEGVCCCVVFHIAEYGNKNYY